METLDELLNTISVVNDEEKFILNIGKLIDLAKERKSIKHTQAGINFLNDWSNKIIQPQNKLLYHYFLSVAWEDKRFHNRYKTQGDWDWEQEEIEHTLINLRLAEKNFDPSFLSIERYYQILTNLANLLDALGRPILSLSYWNRVIKLNKKFGMALANKGNCLIFHGFNSIPDNHFKLFYLQVGYRNLLEGSNFHTDPLAKPFYIQRIKYFESQYPEIVKSKIHIHENKLKLDPGYTGWCLENILFLNPIIDIESYDFATWDNTVLELGSDELNRFFAQITNEFRLARYLFYKSNIKSPTSIEYNDVVEDKKLSFRIAYALFDKIAYLINQFYNLKIPNHRVNFHTMWYLDLQKRKGLRQDFINNNNLFLRGLYWISKDLFYDESGFRNALAPDAKEIAELRNYIEHKSFTVDDNSLSAEFTFAIKTIEFDSKILNLLKMTRECIMYFVYSVQRKSAIEHKSGARNNQSN